MSVLRRQCLDCGRYAGVTGWLLSLLGLGGVAGLGLYIALVPGAVANVMTFLARAVRIIKENPWQVALAAALAWGIYERLDAAHAYGGWHKSDKRYADHIADDKRIAQQVKTQSNTDARGADNVHTVIKVVYRDAATRFIAANRIVVPQGGGISAPAEGDTPGIPAPAASETVMVAVKPDDIHACSDVYAYGLGAYLWGRERVKSGAAEYALPEPDLTLPEPAMSPAP